MEWWKAGPFHSVQTSQSNANQPPDRLQHGSRLFRKPLGLLMTAALIAPCNLCSAAAQDASGSSQNLPKRVIEVRADRPQGPMDEAWRLSVGAERAGVTLRPGNLAQLKEVQKELGFRYIRFHGIFHDDMKPIQSVDGKLSYSWTQIDALYDQLHALHLKPIVELSFMPRELASGKQEVFYWKANVTPPKDMSAWNSFIEAFAKHLISRYGSAEVETWYFEVWNEPNYPGFWPNANQSKYFELYDGTSRTLKTVDPHLLVGGPATAGAGWIPAFLQHAADSRVPVDFVSTHTYGVSSGFLDADGKADLILSPNPDSISGDVRRVVGQIKTSPRPNLPLLITEWSSSYSSRDPVHDSYTNAAFILEKLKQVEGLTKGMSYWTYSDLFEENGPPPSAFYGGFGLITRDDIPKSSFFAFKYLAAMKGAVLESKDSRSWVTVDGDQIKALIWDYTQGKQTEGNKSYFRQLHPSTPVSNVLLRIDHVKPGSYDVLVYKTGYRSNDPYSTYIDMGLPKDLTPAQMEDLKSRASDKPVMQAVLQTDQDHMNLSFPLATNDILLVSILPSKK